MLGAVNVLDVNGQAQVRDPAILTCEAEGSVNDKDGDETQDGVESNLSESRICGSRPDDPVHTFCKYIVS